MRKYYVMTFGCQQNEADSEKFRGMLESRGYSPAETPDEADLVLLNTCAIREHAEDKVFSLLGTFRAKAAADPSFILGVCGCMAAERKTVSKLRASFPFVTFTLDPSAIEKFPQILSLAEEGKKTKTLTEQTPPAPEGLPTVREKKYRGLVTVTVGCNNFCTYCIVPYTRLRERSRDFCAVLDECRALVTDGVREITLLGQNVNSYRSGERDFSDLVEEVAKIPGDFIVRFMTSHPKDVSDRLIAVMGKYTGKVAPAFHLPLQSGSDSVLKRMNRPYTREKYLATVAKLRAAVPDIAVTTDIIVGFPGESDADFEETLAVVKAVRYDNIYPFIFSPRVGTVAEKFTDTVPREVSVSRMEKLDEIAKEISEEKNAAFLGKTVRVLVEEADADFASGRAADTRLVKFSCQNARVGEFYLVTVDRSTPFGLFGTVKK